jgi:ATP-dependent exoDNAse (exonuclease V) alpha subunit
MQQRQGQVQAIALLEVVEAHLQKTTLNSGQQQAVQAAVTTTDQFIAWQGVAGAGKTFALKELKALAIASGYTLKGFAPSSQAAKVLGEELDIEGNTVASLLVSKEPKNVEPKSLWIVDEAGLLSAKDAHALLLRASLEQARVILVGDTKQLSAVEAGNPFKSLQQAGIQTAYLSSSQRQRTPELKVAVDLIAEGKIKAGFERLEAHGCLKEVTAADKVHAIAESYMATKPEERVKTLVLAGTNAERLEITQAIRALLKSEGSLGQEATTRQLKAKDLTTVQMKYTHHFEVGDVVMPTRSYKRRGLEKGELYQVVSKTQDRLTLQSNTGATLQVDTGFSKAVYKQQQMSLAVGDRLKWTKNDRNLGRRNGQEFTVTAIERDTAQIQYLDGNNTETINLAQAQHLDYALVNTTYSSQGKTADRVLIAADYTIGKESFYVAVSRAKNEIKLYTEDKDNLLFLAQQSKAKETVLEVLRQQVRELQHCPTKRDTLITQQLSTSTDTADCR